MSESTNKIQKSLISRDTSKYDSSDGYMEFDFGEIRVTYNPAPFAGLRLEQVDYDKHGKQILRKLNLSHAQAKKLKKELRTFYPRD
jgi:hypothetical protein